MRSALEHTIARIATLPEDVSGDAVEALLVDGYAEALAADGYAAELEHRVQALSAAPGRSSAEREELLALVARRGALVEELGRLRQGLDQLRRDRRTDDVAI